MHQDFVAGVNDGTIVKTNVGMQALEAVTDFDSAGDVLGVSAKNSHDLVPIIVVSFVT